MEIMLHQSTTTVVSPSQDEVTYLYQCDLPFRLLELTGVDSSPVSQLAHTRPPAPRYTISPLPSFSAPSKSPNKSKRSKFLKSSTKKFLIWNEKI